MEILTQSTNTEGHGKARKTLSPVILKGRPTLLYQSKKMNLLLIGKKVSLCLVAVQHCTLETAAAESKEN